MPKSFSSGLDNTLTATKCYSIDNEFWVNGKGGKFMLFIYLLPWDMVTTIVMIVSVQFVQNMNEILILVKQCVVT